jgi:hypothetical protein
MHIVTPRASRPFFLLATGFAVVLGLLLSHPFAAAAVEVTYRNTITPVTYLRAGSRILGDDGSQLVMQADGNLVFYVKGHPNVYACWSTRTNGKPGAFAVLQADGNFVVYSAAGTALWSAGTNGKGFASTVTLRTERGGYARTYVAGKLIGPTNCPSGWVG